MLWSKQLGKKNGNKKNTARKESSRMARVFPEVRQQPVDFIYEQRAEGKQKPKIPELFINQEQADFLGNQQVVQRLFSEL